MKYNFSNISHDDALLYQPDTRLRKLSPFCIPHKTLRK